MIPIFMMHFYQRQLTINDFNAFSVKKQVKGNGYHMKVYNRDKIVLQRDDDFICKTYLE